MKSHFFRIERGHETGFIKVVESRDHSGYFDIEVLLGREVVTTRRPVRIDGVGSQLRAMGVVDSISLMADEGQRKKCAELFVKVQQ